MTGAGGHVRPGMLARTAAALDARLRPVAPPERLAALRIVVGGFAAAYLAIRMPALIGLADLPASGFRPVGVVWPLAAPLPAAAVAAQAIAAVLLGAAFAAGWRFAVTGPAFAIALLWTLTYRSSWGMVFHTENLMVAHVLALGCSRAADAWSLDARRSASAPGPARAYGWPIRLMALLTALTYVLAGIAKLRLSGPTWITSDILRNYVAYDNLRKLLLADTHSPLGAWLVAHPRLFPPLAALSLAMELLAPLALLGPRAARVWALGAWAFHAGVLAIMAIFFPYPLLGLAFAPLFAVERLPLLRRLGERRA